MILSFINSYRGAKESERKIYENKNKKNRTIYFLSFFFLIL